MPGADRMLQRLVANGIRPVLVTGSGQSSPKIGKPNPEPYLMGLTKAGVNAHEAFVIENAPLGVTAGAAAQVFTVAVDTGPIPAQALLDAGADLVYPTMPDFAEHIDHLIELFKQTR